MVEGPVQHGGASIRVQSARCACTEQTEADTYLTTKGFFKKGCVVCVCVCFYVCCFCMCLFLHVCVCVC